MPTRSFWRCSMPLDDLLVVLIEENVVVALVLYTNEDSVDVVFAVLAIMKFVLVVSPDVMHPHCS